MATRRIWQCTACDYQVSLTAGTVLHKTHTPLRLWFWAAYLMTTGTPGISAVQLQRQLGLSRYQTAWTMLHKLRRAVTNPASTLLAGEVEVDECEVGGREPGRRSGRSLTAKAAEAAEAAEVIVAGYAPLARNGYEHRPRSQRAAKRGGNPDPVMPRVHRIDRARSVAYSRNGPSGVYLAGLLQELGIAEQVNARATVVDQGFTALALLDGRADLAVQQMSELLFVPEANIAGPLPAEVQHYTAFSAGIATTDPATDDAGTPQAGALLAWLTAGSAAEAYAAAGLEPAG